MNNLFELMAVIVISMVLSSTQFTNFALERTKGIGSNEAATLSYYGAKIQEICNDTQGACTGIEGTKVIPGSSPSVNGQSGTYWTDGNNTDTTGIKEPLSGTTYAMQWAAAASGNANQYAFSLDDPAKFTYSQIPNAPLASGADPTKTLYLHYDSCRQGDYADNNATSTPSC